MLGQCQPKCVGAKTRCEDLLLAKAWRLIVASMRTRSRLLYGVFTTFKMLARTGGLDCLFKELALQPHEARRATTESQTLPTASRTTRVEPVMLIMNAT